MRLLQSLRRHARPLRETLSFHPMLDVLEDRLTPDSRLLGNPIASAIGPLQSFQTYTNSTIDQPTDIYLYQFQATAGYWFSAQTQPSAGAAAFTTDLRLFDSAGNAITAQVNNNGPSTNVLLDLVIPATGTYYLGVAGDSNTSYNPVDGTGTSGGAIGNYELQMSLWQMTGTANQDRTFTVTGAAAGGNRLEFYPELTATGAQGAAVTVVYHLPGDPNAYYAYNPTGVVNYRFNMGLGGGNQVVIANGNLAGYSNIIYAVMYQTGALISYGPNASPSFNAGSTVDVTGCESIYLYGNANTDTAYMLDSPEENIFTGTYGYSSETAAPGSAQPYLNFAAGFETVSARRYFFGALDRAYFYASGFGDSFDGDSFSFTVGFAALVTQGPIGARGPVPGPLGLHPPSVSAFNCDSAILYDQPAAGSAHGLDYGTFTESDVFYGTSAYAYSTGIMGVVPEHNFFNEVFDVDGGNADGGNTAYLVEPANYTVTGFTNFITS